MTTKFLSLFIPMFILMDFIGTIPLFISLTKKFSQRERVRIAFSSSAIAGIIVLVFSILGRQIMNYFNISIEAVKVGGGLLLLYIAFQMILSTHSGDEKNGHTKLRNIIVSPLAIPMLAGPGSMTFGMISYLGLYQWDKLYLMSSILSAVVIGALLLSASSYIERFLGTEFTKGMEKIMAVLVSFISLEMMMSGIKAYFF
ncbi:MAG TPA: MarC family protein [Spirochaetota bacterium]|nr:MarC family protein [Spirochaetota bacterium]HPS85179.1 MarC family protein [Spirochaetota bacterium]